MAQQPLNNIDNIDYINRHPPVDQNIAQMNISLAPKANEPIPAADRQILELIKEDIGGWIKQYRVHPSAYPSLLNIFEKYIKYKNEYNAQMNYQKITTYHNASSHSATLPSGTNQQEDQPKTEFQKEVASKLENILAKLDQCGEIINNLTPERLCSLKDSDFADLEIDKTFFPMHTKSELMDFENKLRETTFYHKILLMKSQQNVETFNNKTVTVLKKTVDDANITSSIFNLLETLLSVELSNKFSWGGYRSKSAVKHLLLVNVIKDIIHFHFTDTSDKQIEALISRWFFQAEKRLQKSKGKSVEKPSDESQ